jgi:hypothetical protein
MGGDNYVSAEPVDDAYVADGQWMRIAPGVEREHLEGGCLACAVGPQQRKHLSLLDSEAHAAQRIDLAVALEQTVDFDRYCRHHARTYAASASR